MTEPSTLLTPAEQGELRHDLRTPFNAIIGYVQMIQERASEDGLDALVPGLVQVEARADQLLNVINAALGSERRVQSGELPALGKRIAQEVPPLVTLIDGLIAQSGTLGDADALSDLKRTREAAGVLLKIGSERMVHRAGPVPDGAQETKPPAVPPVQRHGPARKPLSGVVLAVDDSEANRDVLCRRLEREGCTAVPAKDGEEALRLLDGGGFDVVLLDLLMPGLDGYSVLRQMKAAPRWRDIPVVMISALDELDSVVRCIEAGAEDYLPKPFDPVLLRARVGACLEKKRLRDRELEYLRGVQDLEEAASAVEGSTFEPAQLNKVAAREDELGRLARLFQRMATEVQAREKRLKEEVAQLRIEIDMVRLTKQVGEVTGEDFFKAAQDAGKRRRDRRKPE